MLELTLVELVPDSEPVSKTIIFLHYEDIRFALKHHLNLYIR